MRLAFVFFAALCAKLGRLIGDPTRGRVNRDVLPLVREEEAVAAGYMPSSALLGDDSEGGAAARSAILALEDTIVTEIAQSITAVRDFISVKVVWCELRAELLEQLYRTDAEAIAKFKVRNKYSFSCLRSATLTSFVRLACAQAEQKKSGKAAVDTEPSCICSHAKFSSGAAARKRIRRP
eukprot:COSAG01_NODE_1398_length_10466_cov_173.518086_8_plen_180_part_00